VHTPTHTDTLTCGWAGVILTRIREVLSSNLGCDQPCWEIYRDFHHPPPHQGANVRNEPWLNYGNLLFNLWINSHRLSEAIYESSVIFYLRLCILADSASLALLTRLRQWGLLCYGSDGSDALIWRGHVTMWSSTSWTSWMARCL
jgi:hypothetical protein